LGPVVQVIASLVAALQALLPTSSVPRSVPVPQSVPVPLSIAVSGNHFVNGQGATVRLLGVNAPGTEYACDQGWAYSPQPANAAEASALASWHASAVRVPLNEDCWLGINGKPSYGTASGYRQAIQSWVTLLNGVGIYAILDLHWTAPGTLDADGQRPMPDDHSAAFWTSVATAYKTNPAVVFDAFNEPYSPAGNGNSTRAVSWACWRDGGCLLPVANQLATINDNVTYSAVGMQTLVNSIRATRANQPIILGGLKYANDLSGWLANKPTDSAGQLAASFHNYEGQGCPSSCWQSTVATVAASVPIVTGEFDQGYDCINPPASSGWDESYLTWADAHGVSYLAWGWWVLPDSARAYASLPGGGGDLYALISDYGGTPVAPDGTILRAHLAAAATTPGGPSGPPIPPAPTGPFGAPLPPLSVCRWTQNGVMCMS
jgi:endoglucanase